MTLRTLMQAGPARANDLFARLADSSDGAVKTREKLFAELKTELERHAGLEEEHLFPVLRRNAETRGLVADAIKDNKELRAKLAELESLPKDDEGFLGRLAELRKAFRQHARDEKTELLPAVRRALSEEQVQNVAEKMEASLAEAEQARQAEAEERRAKARQERERAERQAEQEAAAEQARRAEARHEREVAERQEAVERERRDAERRAAEAARGAIETAARTAAAANVSVLRATERAAEDAAEGTRRAGAAVLGTAAAQAAGARTVQAATDGAAALQSAWMEWLSRAALAGAEVSQRILLQATEGQRRFAAEALRGWMEHNARVLQIARHMAGEGLRPLPGSRSDATGSDARGPGDR